MASRTAIAVFIVLSVASFVLLLYLSLSALFPDYVLFVRLEGIDYEDGRLLVLSLTPRGLVGSAYRLVPGWVNYPIPLDSLLGVWLETGEAAPVPSVTVGVAVRSGDRLCQTSFSVDSLTLIVKHLYEERGAVNDQEVVKTYTEDPLAGFKFYPRLVVTVTEEFMECRRLPAEGG